jgi:dolichol-phosphate mannosyltransferase
MNDANVRERSLTIVVPALNEEEKISLTIADLLPALRAAFERFEIIMINDGSCDGTGAAMDRLAREHAELRVIHHAVRRGVGASYCEAIADARMDYVTLVPGDNECDPKMWPEFFRAVGTSDLVIGYRVNQVLARKFYRVAISRLYTFVMCSLFGLRIRDFHSLLVYPTSVLRELELRSSTYGYQLEALVQMSRRGMSYAQVPVILLPVQGRSSRSLALKTLAEITRTAWRLFWMKRPARKSATVRA